MRAAAIVKRTVLALLLTAADPAVAACVDATPEVAAMAEASIRIGERTLPVRLARSTVERAAGMQRLCPEAIARLNLLFVFPEPKRAHFHMWNVHAPLDIAFLDADGRVLEVRRMRPNEEIQAREPASAALEAAAGRFGEWGLTVGTRVRLAR